MTHTFPGALIILLNAALGFWVAEISLIVGLRVWQNRSEYLGWWVIAEDRKRLLACLLGTFLFTGFVAAQKIVITWISGEWPGVRFAIWYMPVGAVGALLMLWWACTTIFGHPRGWAVWLWSVGVGLLLGALALLGLS